MELFSGCIDEVSVAFYFSPGMSRGVVLATLLVDFFSCDSSVSLPGYSELMLVCSSGCNGVLGAGCASSCEIWGYLTFNRPFLHMYNTPSFCSFL